MAQGAKKQGHSTFLDHLGLRVSEGRRGEEWGSEAKKALDGHALGSSECPYFLSLFPPASVYFSNSSRSQDSISFELTSSDRFPSLLR